MFTLLFLTLQSLYAQGSGSIKGRVLDNETGSLLIGANVVIQNTSLGTPTDLAGGFYLRSVPVGQYTLRVSYIGYVGVTREVTVSENETLELEFRLVPQAITGETVVVTAQAFGQQAAINQQLTSNTIINVVSSEKIHQLPDASAATALSRLPGVSLMNGDQIVIRGVQAKLNQILINGIELPSTDMNNNVQQILVLYHRICSPVLKS